jgi:Zn-dependent protease
MLLDLLLTGDIRGAIISFLLSVPVIILVLSVHEYAHGYVAKKLGDPTAENLGRLTLNPLKHIDLIGFLMFLVVGVGYAKPVPINSRYFKKPRRDMALVGAAGPISNFLMAILFTGIIKILQVIFSFVPVAAVPEWTPAALGYAFQILGLGVFYNLAFMIFNLIPVPPLDGSRILYAFLPSKALLWVQKYERFFFWGILALFFLSSFLNISPIGIAVDFLMKLLFKLFFIA